jgi:hypothetical protein
MSKQNFTAFVTGIILGCIILLSINPQTHVDVNMQREIQRLNAKRDSLQNIVNLSGDSLKIAFHTIRLLNLERDSLQILANSKHKVYEKIVFRTYTDHQRDSILSELYPSFRPVR